MEALSRTVTANQKALMENDDYRLLQRLLYADKVGQRIRLAEYIRADEAEQLIDHLKAIFQEFGNATDAMANSGSDGIRATSLVMGDKTPSEGDRGDKGTDWRYRGRERRGVRGLRGKL